MDLIVLAGGFGTRLQSVLNGLPKPLVDVNGQLFLKILFEKWIFEGFSNFVLSLHYGSDKIIEFVNEEKNNGILKNHSVKFMEEPKPLGTGGAISHVVTQLDLPDELYIANADTWLGGGYNKMFNNKSNVIGIVEVHNVARYGQLEINNDQLITSFNKKNAD